MAVNESAGSNREFGGLEITPFHFAGFAFLALGLGLGIYQGIQHLGVVSDAGWIGWSHIHFVTVGAFTQLIFGMLPQLTARKVNQPGPAKPTTWGLFIALNGGFILAWIGRGWGYFRVYDTGVLLVLLAVVGLFLLVLKSVAQGERSLVRDATVGLYLVAPVVFLYGLVLAFGLYSHGNLFDVPGGWWGLREAHVHANAWGFLGLIAIGTLYDVFPKLVNTSLYSRRMKGYSFWFFVIGIGPLAVGPALGMGRTITATGLVFFAIGYLMFFINLMMTFQSGSSSGLSWSVLLAQIWILGPAGFAPFILFGVPIGIPERSIEAGALHFFFMGWALPIALAGLAIYFRNLPPAGKSTDEIKKRRQILPKQRVPGSVIRPEMVLLWNVGVLLAGISLFYQDQTWSVYALATGFGVLILIWLYYMLQIGWIRWHSLLRTPSHG